MDILRRYELYVIFQPDLDDEQLESQIAQTDNYLSGNGGEIIEVVRKGKRRLQYAIKRSNQGIDVIYQANLPTSSLETLERQLNLNENVIRYLIVRRDDLDATERVLATEAELEAEAADLQAIDTDLLDEEVEETTDLLDEEATSEDEPALAADAELVEEDISMMEGSAERASAAEEAESADEAERVDEAEAEIAAETETVEAVTDEDEEGEV